MSIRDNTPILIGAGQRTWREADPGRTPVDALSEVTTLALTDTGQPGLAASIDTVAMVRFIADTDPGTGALFPRNPGRQVANRLGISDADFYQGVIGGNTPQYLVNHFARGLAAGKHEAVLISGAELLATMFSALGTGGDISAWSGESEEEPLTLGTERDGLNESEKLHGLYEPINTYPLFEMSLRHRMGHSTEQHHKYIADICSSMSAVAGDNPHAWNREVLSSDAIASPEGRNRYIGYPYTKAMNPVLGVDMAAAVVMTTVGKARELGIAPEKWIYVRGGVDVNDIWHISERPSLHESPAIRRAWQALSDSAGITLDAVTDFDIYSCFPSAVAVACNEIGFSPLDSRGVTVTGGLPYLGGPGNNYSLHGIAEMVSTLRQRGSGTGLVSANGLYLTKHSLGLYSTEPGEGWAEVDSHVLQREIDTGPRLSLAEDPTGPATLESYTIAFDRNGPKMGIAIARNSCNERIVANMATDAEVLSRVLSENLVGAVGTVTQTDGKNTFHL